MLRFRVPVPRLLSAGEIFSGRGCIGVLRSLAAVRTVLIWEPPISHNEELKTLFKRALGTVDLRFVEKKPGEPRLSTINGVLAELVEFNPDWIVAVGGGSVIDCAKLAWAFYEHPDADLSRITRPNGLPALRGKARLVAAPTTAGTGSEVSSAALFIDDATGSKRYVVSNDFLPDVAVLDPTLAVSAPAAVTAISGLDALTHAVEGYVSRFSNPFIDMHAETAVRKIFTYLKKCIEYPEDLEMRLQMMQAALLAGWVQNLKIPGIAHAVAHQLGQFNVPHGLACGCLLPVAIRVNSEIVSVAAKYTSLANVLGLETAEELAAACEKLIYGMGIKLSVLDVVDGGLPRLKSQYDNIAKGAQADICARANPRPVDERLVEKMLEGLV